MSLLVIVVDFDRLINAFPDDFFGVLVLIESVLFFVDSFVSLVHLHVLELLRVSHILKLTDVELITNLRFGLCIFTLSVQCFSLQVDSMLKHIRVGQ